jgi:hypothetical protein
MRSAFQPHDFDSVEFAGALKWKNMGFFHTCCESFGLLLHEWLAEWNAVEIEVRIFDWVFRVVSKSG